MDRTDWKKIFKEKSTPELIAIYIGDSFLDFDCQILAGVELLNRGYDKVKVLEIAKSLKAELIEKVELIRCGGGDPVIAAREQWNDGSNTLTIAPGVVIVYNRNTVTNKLLREAGITVHEFDGSELVRGRGGPRCMSMPLYREDL